VLTCITEEEKKKFRNWLSDIINSDQELQLAETQERKTGDTILSLAMSSQYNKTDFAKHDGDIRDAKVNLEG
jgi:hypothetical protein